ncbi:MAG: hypothetical protein MUF10_19400 [Thermoanaerobaculaceae bacterium]|jgi:hypothetical protein|nr:hypothetical protein [Thermoanaerobaculaceae bacterium]
MMQPLDRLRSLRNLVDNTPLLAIRFRLDGAERTVPGLPEDLPVLPPCPRR